MIKPVEERLFSVRHFTLYDRRLLFTFKDGFQQLVLVTFAQGKSRVAS